MVAKSYTPLLKYSFADESSKVSVYVPIDNIETVAKEQVNVTFTKNSFDLIVTNFQDKDLRLTMTVRHRLRVLRGCAPVTTDMHSIDVCVCVRMYVCMPSSQNLHDDINTETSKFLIRAGKIIVILRKATESSWSELRKKE